MRHRLKFTAAGCSLLVALLAPVADRAAAQEWQIVAEMPTVRTGMAVATHNDRILIIGGRTRNERATETVLAFDPARKTWSDDIGQLHEPRVNPAVVSLGSKILVIGGRNHEGEVLHSVEVYDPRQNAWQEFPELNRQREGATAVVVRDQVFVIGGSDQNERALETVETFNAVEERWDEVRDWMLDSPRVSAGVAVVGSTIYIFGGFNVFGPVGGLQSYDTDLAATRSVDMPIPRGGLAAIPVAKTVYVLGGRSRDGVLNTVSLYQTSDGTWADTAPMKVSRYGFGAVRFKDTIFAFGGIGREGNPLASVEAFGPLGTSSERPTAPTDFGLDATFPNPFFDTVSITMHVSAQLAAPASLDILDLAGRVVQSLELNRGVVGDVELAWDGRNANGTLLAAGVYFVRLSQGPHAAVKKLVLLR